MTDFCYEPVKYHSRQKHAFLEAYLRIWQDKVAANHGSKAPSLSFFDLFASTGWCHNADRNETWEGTATLLAQCLAKHPSYHPKTLFLNTFHANAERLETQRKSLESVINEYPLRPKDEVILNCDSFEVAVEKALKTLNADFPSLWVLDPYAASVLPWQAVERIANTRGQNYSRQPELFINLMTMDLQENMPHNPHVVSAALGMDEAEWRPAVEALEQIGLNKREAVVEIYGRRLEALFGKPPYTIEVKSVHGPVVYVVFFCSSNDAAFHMMRKESLPKYAQWQERKWKPRAKGIVASKKADKAAAAVGQKQRRLFE